VAPLFEALGDQVKYSENARATIFNNQSNHAVFASVTTSRLLEWQSYADHVQWPKERETIHYACQIYPE
jgi:hypothetical protein